MNKMNNKAWIRIVEAFIAIIIITSAFLIIIQNQTSKADIEKVIHEKQTEILNMISDNETLRAEILNEDTIGTNQFITKVLPNNFGFDTNICELNEICPGDTPLDKQIYVSERMIASNLTKYSPKKLRFFIWMRD